VNKRERLCGVRNRRMVLDGRNISRGFRAGRIWFSLLPACIPSGRSGLYDTCGNAKFSLDEQARALGLFFRATQPSAIEMLGHVAARELLECMKFVFEWHLACSQMLIRSQVSWASVACCGSSILDYAAPSKRFLCQWIQDSKNYWHCKLP